ncbi:MAG: hypothetical protein GY870_09635 [archaeon]|nr:hypothetical protein [archaeon]
MAKQLKFSDFYSKEFLSDVAKLNKLVGENATEWKNLAAVAKQLQGIDPIKSKERGAQLKQTIQLTKDLTISNRELTKNEIEGQKLKQQVINTTTKELTLQSKKITLSEKERKIKERQIKLTKDLNSAYKQESKRLEELRNKAKDVGITFGQASTQFKKVQSEVIKLDSKLKKLDNNLGLNQRSVGKYSDALKGVKGRLQKTGGYVKGVLTHFVRLSSAMGLATSVSAIFSKGLQVVKDSISSTQTTGDKFAITAGKMKGAYTAFVKSISVGDWSNLFSNMKEAARLGAEYVKIMDDLGDRQRDLAITEAEVRKETTKLKLEVDNVNLSNAERIKSAKEILRLETELLTQQKSVKQQAFDAEVININKAVKLNEEQLISFLKNYDEEKKIREEIQDYLAEELYIKEQISSLELEKKTISGLGSALTIPDKTRKSIVDYQAELRELPKTLSETQKTYLEIYKEYALSTDTELDKVTKAYIDLQNVTTSYYTGSRRSMNQYNSLLKQINKTKLDSIETETELIEELEKESDAIEDITDNLEELNNLELDPNFSEFFKELDNLELETESLEQYGSALSGIFDKFENLKESGIADTLSDIASQSLDLINQKLEAEENELQVKIDASQTKIDTLKSELDKERELKDKGYANDYNRKQKQIKNEQTRLRTMQRLQEDNLSKQKRIAKTLITVQSGMIISDMILTVAKIFKTYAANPWLAAGMASGAVSTALGLGILIKNKFEDGEVDINGKSHKEGGINAEIEGGESVVSKKNTKKTLGFQHALHDGAEGIDLVYALQKDLGVNPQSNNMNSAIYQEMVKNNYLISKLISSNENKPIAIDNKIITTIGQTRRIERL